MSILRRLFRTADDAAALDPLYAAIVARARLAGWYREGGVPDTLDGRFDMVATILSLVLIRLEAEGPAGASPAALVTERFIADMDGQLRELGLGDVVIGKHVGKLMGALGGRLDAYRRTIGGPEFAAALVRNVYRDAPPADDAVALVAERLRALAAALAATPLAELLAGRMPQP